MANSKQARKRARQSDKRNMHNKSIRSMFRTYIKRTQEAIASGDKSAAETAFSEAMPVIDRVAGKGLIHKNKAARHKSRLSQQISAMTGAKKAAAPKKEAKPAAKKETKAAAKPVAKKASTKKTEEKKEAKPAAKKPATKKAPAKKAAAKKEEK